QGARSKEGASAGGASQDGDKAHDDNGHGNDPGKYDPSNPGASKDGELGPAEDQQQADDQKSPILETHDAAGAEDTHIPLQISFSLQDTSSSESLHGDIVLTNIPEGATLNVGSAGPENTWIIPQDALHVTATNDAGQPTAWDIPGLAITPPEHSDADFTLGVQVTTMENDQPLVTEGTIEVTVDDPDITPVVSLDDGNNGHGNDADGYDESNPGNSDGVNGGEGADGDQGNSGDENQAGQTDDNAGADPHTFTSGAGDDTMIGGAGNDLFLFGSGGGLDHADGGAGGSWLDTVQLQDAGGAATQSLEHTGDWTLQTNAEYTVDAEHHTIDFTDGDASGTITLQDGSVLEFTNMERIEW
ncbi:MAG: hypothetical protein HQL96_17890, partial [Magnetococcales bacterium]|nr:hypothetical protein [Magnetococcales bacterium]